ncbi:hypothetical protein [Lacticaseibacillus brantae]|uniref:Uncharacterized protein n=1 Tax=Lacticaseibacillus brantae DSM 23927 TaxID=1423727 RepID=A0A0R2AX06_9LACO|nr:hypothetical protein [Lacticaseibacillus brantae]KRM71928.1 hypothetical protein FC34_GL000908 [Lacticaseibacillus brantae DSM 23927]
MTMTVYDVLRTIKTDSDTYFDHIQIEGKEFPVDHRALVEIMEAKTITEVEDLATVDIPTNTARFLRIPVSFLEDEDMLAYGDELEEYHTLVETLEGLLEDGLLADPVHQFMVTQDERLVINDDLV